LTKQTIDELSNLKIISKEEVCFTEVKRTKYAYVINDLDFYRNINIVRNFTKKMKIDLVGRFSEFRYLNIDACIRSAMEYVKNYE